MSTGQSSANTSVSCPGDDEIDLLELLIVFARNKFFIVGTVFLFAAIAAGATFFMTPAYKATAKFIPLSFDSPISVSVIADVVNSRPLLNDVALQMNLAKVWNNPNPSEVIKSLEKATTFQVEKGSPSMSISAELSDPNLAAEVTNTIVAETEKRLYFLHEEQMIFVKKRKASLENELRDTQKELNRAEEALIKAVGSYNVPQETKKELTDYRRNTTETNTTVLQQLPDGGAAYLDALRNLRTQETFYFSLLSQYSKVLEQEKAEPISFQFLEKAAVPEQRSRPHKTLIVVLACFLGGLAGVFGAFIREFTRNAQKNPERKAKLEELSGAIKLFGKRKNRES